MQRRMADPNTRHTNGAQEWGGTPPERAPVSSPPGGTRQKYFPWLGVVLGIVLVLGVIGVGGYEINKTLNPTPQVKLYVVSNQLLTNYIGGGGLTYATQMVTLTSPGSGVVTSLNVQVGENVTKGQLLATVLVQSVQSSQIVAPFAGNITAVNVSVGAPVFGGEQLIVVQDESSIIARVQIPLAQRPYLRVGESATVNPAAIPGQTFLGKVSAINTALTNTGSDTFDVWVTVPNPVSLLLVGESVYIQISVQMMLPTVPELAVINPDADSIVFLYANGRAHVQSVVVATRDNNLIGIQNGLSAGQEVILVGQYQLTDNEPVIVAGTEH